MYITDFYISMADAQRKWSCLERRYAFLKNARWTAPYRLTQNNSEDNDHQNNRKYQEKAASLTSCLFLVLVRRP